MKFLIQIFILFFTWFTNPANATPVFSKVALPTYEFSFPKTENQKLESELKNSVSNFSRSNISENSFSQKIVWWESFVIENRAREVFVKVVNTAGNWLSTLKSNASFAYYFDGLANGTITRKFANSLSIEKEAVLKFYTTNAGYKDFK